jgi:ubiquinone/menaquinone biosynthesis C-methylase UbiE
MLSQLDQTIAQAELDQANAAFWEELCGTGLARSLGITDQGPAALHRFDQAYFEMYPYLLPLVRPERMRGGHVLEIGLGFGTLGQKLAEHAADYTGLDIAAKPVALMNQRLRLAGLPGQAVQGSCHHIPLPDESVDFVVSIGCFHHTGNVQRCLDETYRVLRPGGAAVLMVYNKFSFRQWVKWPKATFREALRGLWPRGQGTRLEKAQRWTYDHNAQGEAAPEVTALSIGELRRMTRRFARVTFRKRNCDNLFYGTKLLVRRERLLSTLGRLLGLDIYFEVVKGTETAARRAA